MVAAVPRGDRRGPAAVAVLALVALLAAAGYFLWRGVLRGSELSFDLKYGYASVQALLQGLDPYDASHLERVLVAGGGTTDFVVGELRNVYFPTTLPVFAPIAVGSWQVAHLAALALNLALTVLIVVGLLRHLGWPLASVRSVLLAAAVLALAPIHTAIADGQTSVAAVAVLVGAMVLARREGASGALTGLATAIKVQVGLPFVALLAVRGRWRALVAASAVILGLTVVALVPLSLSGHDWLGHWQDNLRWVSGPHGPNYTGSENPGRVSLVNLQYPLRQLGASDAQADLLAFAFGGGVAILYLWRSRRPSLDRDLLDASVVGVLTMLVTYHRFYDAVLLVFPVAWAFEAWHRGRRGVAALVLLCCADFLFPFQTALGVTADEGRLPTWLTENVIWDAVALAQHVWALVVLALVLALSGTRVQARVGGPEAGSANG